jgi:hypothetical protein
MKRKLIYLPVIILYFFSLSGSAQVIDSMMKVYSDRYPQEKLYIQFDKKAYNPGERIWYKAYLLTDLIRRRIVKISMLKYLMQTETCCCGIQVLLSNPLHREF